MRRGRVLSPAMERGEAISPNARVILLAGPTASGKSRLAMTLARERDAVILNADSQQLYADLRILSARPSEADEAEIEHRLYGVADAADAWSVGRWLRAIEPELGALAREGRAAVVVGGTGLYFRALTEGLADIPPVPLAAREEATALYDTEGEDAFRLRLSALDPPAAGAISPGDRQRLTRAFSVARATGRALSDWQALTHPALKPGEYEARVIEPDRADLYARCDARVGAMVERGALDEVRALAARNLDPSLPAMKAVGVREFAAHLAEQTDLATAVDATRQATRRYAKRQLTWLRNQTPDWPRLQP